MRTFLLMLGILLFPVQLVAGGLSSGGQCYGPKSYTPALSGFTTPGTPTYSLQSGTYVRCGREIFAHFAIVTTALTGTVGTLILSLPVTASNGSFPFSGDCYLSQYEGWTAPAGFTYIGIAVLGGAALASFDRSGSAQATALSDVSEWAAATTLRGTCVYTAGN